MASSLHPNTHKPRRFERETIDFRLVGPGTSKVLTSVGFTGTKSVVLKLKKGSYRFFCAPHADDMHGGFAVA